MTGSFLLEIGTEEIPAGFIPGAMEGLKSLLSSKLSENRLTYKDIKVMGSPRRLACVIEDLLLRQEDQEIQVYGPPKQAAYDSNGNPTKAAQGFARAHGIDVDQLTLAQTAKGECLCARKKTQGRAAADVLSQLLPSLITALPFPKSMRWGGSTISFARPIHWITALLEGKVVEFEVDGIKSSNQTRGHRFMAPEPFTVTDHTDYIEKLARANVIVDQQTRTQTLREAITEEATRNNGRILDDEDLVQTNTYLVEYPSTVCGSFEEKFLALPREVLITAMREHQKYFAVVDDKGKLLPRFVAVNNTVARDTRIVRTGHERVLRARLEDARFFFEEDRKHPLSLHAEKLKNVLFQSKLGTSYQKMERFRELASFMAGRIRPELMEDVQRSAYLCKADLVTEMVQEFPTLQGVMGKVYCKLSGENDRVAESIEEHYLPRFSGDDLPRGDIGALVGMADRLDTIVGCFGIGLIPTGAADPYALRRHTLSIIHILLDKQYDLDLKDLIEESLRLLKGRTERPEEKVAQEVMQFFRVRFQRLLSDRGFAHDVLEAVLSLYLSHIPDALKRVEALESWRKRPEFKSLATSFKRVMNIIKDQPTTGDVDSGLFKAPEEKTLFDGHGLAAEKVQSHLDKKSYENALGEIFALRDTIDGFFDAVMVMDNDERIRRNRLNLLHMLAETFKRVADFSKLEV